MRSKRPIIIRNLVYKIKVIISSIIIAFFCSAFIILIITLFFGPTINKGLSILNTLSLEINFGKNETITYNKIEKKLDVLPNWGTIFGQIKIPSIGVDLPVYHGDDTIQLAAGVGHYAGSQFPGEGGTIILAAHNTHKFFYNLPKIEKGALIDVETIYGNFQYEVYDTKIANYKDEDAFFLQNEKEVLVLYTCYPLDTLWYVKDRFIVYAKLVGDVE